MPTQIERPAVFSKKIQALLAAGSVEEACGSEGKLLQEMMTAEEKDALMDLPFQGDEPPGFDADSGTCDMCRGQFRFKQCGKCHGFHENLPPRGA